MRLYIVRHGKAADEGYRYDEDRPLTDEGRRLMRRTAKAWAAEAGDKSPELWLSSPLVRAVQTCEIAVKVFDQEGPVEITRALVPEASAADAAALLERKGVPGVVAFVSHEPLVSDLASTLLGRRWMHGFKKGAVLTLKGEPGGEWKLLWYLEPAKDDKDPKRRDEL